MGERSPRTAADGQGESRWNLCHFNLETNNYLTAGKRRLDSGAGFGGRE
jgi:hypothetical protein